MTTPSWLNQEAPIRRTTAVVYITHVKLFLGWYTTHHIPLKLISNSNNTASIHEPSLFHLFPSKTRSGADLAYSFVQWLRETRKISVTYEANLVRGLTKLAKWIYHTESSGDVVYSSRNGKSYEDIPLILELRKLHCVANKIRATAPRVSDEKKKWLSWSEFLAVCGQLREDYINDLNASVAAVRSPSDSEGDATTDSVTDEVYESMSEVTRRRIATKLQRYLVLAIFSVVPDRQRTIRELALGTTLQRQEEVGSLGPSHYIIKHGPNDYKTG